MVHLADLVEMDFLAQRVLQLRENQVSLVSMDLKVKKEILVSEEIVVIHQTVQNLMFQMKFVVYLVIKENQVQLEFQVLQEKKVQWEQRETKESTVCLVLLDYLVHLDHVVYQVQEETKVLTVLLDSQEILEKMD